MKIRTEYDFNTRILKKYKQYGNEKSRVYYYPQIYVLRWYMLFLGYGWKDIHTAWYESGPEYGTVSLDEANDVLGREVINRQPRQVEVESSRMLTVEKKV